MRIGLSANFFEPAMCHKLDGIGTYTQELHRQLQNAGDDVIPIIFPTLKKLNPQCQLPKAHKMNMPYSVSGGLAALGFTMPGTQALAQKIDIYHCTDYLVPRIKDVPVLAMIHDAVKVQRPEWNGGRFRSLKTWGLKKSALWADHYVAPSRAVIPELEAHFGIDPLKVTVIYNAIADNWFDPIDPNHIQATLNKYQLKPGFLLFTGTFQPRKNIARIVQVFKNLPKEVQREHPLILVGQRGWIEESVIKEIKLLEQEGVLRWLNYIPTDELRCLYQSALLFLFPSLHEGFGIPILEAFASSLPVITSNVAAMPEVAGDAAFLVDPTNEESIRNGILSLIEDSDKRAELIMKGHERVKNFTWQRCLENTRTLYQKVMR